MRMILSPAPMRCRCRPPRSPPPPRDLKASHPKEHPHDPPARHHRLRRGADAHGRALRRMGRSEEHTSELQSRMRTTYAVFCLTKNSNTTTHAHLDGSLQHEPTTEN